MSAGYVLYLVSRTCSESVLSTRLHSGRAGTARVFTTNMKWTAEQHKCW